MNASRFILSFAWAVLLLGIPIVISGQEPGPRPETSPPVNTENVAADFRAERKSLPELGRVGVTADQRPLSLREAIELALENNKEIEVARHDVKIAEFDLLGARGNFDPRITFGSFYERVETPITNFLSGGEGGAISQSDYVGSARLEGLSPKFGGNYRLEFSSARHVTNNQFFALNPQYPTSLTFSYTQPLWRGLRVDNTRRQIEIARKNLSLTDSQFRQRAIDTITNVQTSYWDLVFALRNLQIQRDGLQDSKTQLEHNKRLVEQGVLAPIDVVAVEAQVALFEQQVFTAMEDVSRVENNLKSLIAASRQAEIWEASLIPTDSVELAVPQVTLPEALATALDNRPELQQSNLAREINEIDQNYFRDQTKPAIDLVSGYNMVGLSGSVNSSGTNPFLASNALLRERVDLISQLNNLPPLPVPPVQTLAPELVGGYSQSFQNLLSQKFSNVRVGVQVTLPLRNRTAEAQLGRSLAEGQRIATRREQLEQAIQLEVRNSLQALRSAEARVRAAVIARDASEQQYSSEQRKLVAGQSTVFLVLERQTALTTARGNELRAQTDLNKAIVELQRATGNALTVNHVLVSAR